MQVGDLVLHGSTGRGTTRNPGIVLKVYDYRFDHLTEEGSKLRGMATVQWFHISTTMEHRQDRLEVLSESR